MRRGSAARPATGTRDRILDAAVRRFSRYSYEETGLRDVAADVGIDVSYVHRCFGSKQQLFAEALAATVDSDLLLATSTSNLAEALAKQVVAHDGPLDIIVHSLTSPEASRVVRDFILNDFINPLAKKFNQSPNAQIALVAAFLAGVGILRSVLRTPPLLEIKGAELEKLIARTIKGLMRKDTAVRRA